MESFSTEKLINAVEKHPCVYVKSSADYRNKLKRAKAWESMGKSLNMEGTKCMNKWRSVRDRYAREVSKVLRSCSAAEIHCSYLYMEQLSFLKEHVLPRKTTSSVTPSSASNVDEELADGFALIDHLNESCGTIGNSFNMADFIDEEAEPSYSFEDVNIDLPSASSPSTLDSSNFGRRTKKGSALEDSFKNFMQKMTELHEKRVNSVVPGKHDAFLQLVKTKLDELLTEEQEDVKIFFLNHLHEKAKEKRNL